ncbi:MAG: preprotein translocase subunit SecG [Gammaproteobacteria bacterium]
MFSILMMLQVVFGLLVIGLVLLQQGKGADMGAAFGSGASGSVFGAQGSSSFLTRLTGILAAAFFINSVLLSSPLVNREANVHTSVTESIGNEVETESAVMPEPTDLPLTDLPPTDLPSIEQGSDASDLPLTDLPASDLPVVEVPQEVPVEN